MDMTARNIMQEKIFMSFCKLAKREFTDGPEANTDVIIRILSAAGLMGGFLTDQDVMKELDDFRAKMRRKLKRANYKDLSYNDFSQFLHEHFIALYGLLKNITYEEASNRVISKLENLSAPGDEKLVVNARASVSHLKKKPANEENESLAQLKEQFGLIYGKEIIVINRNQFDRFCLASNCLAGQGRLKTVKLILETFNLFNKQITPAMVEIQLQSFLIKANIRNKSLSYQSFLDFINYYFLPTYAKNKDLSPINAKESLIAQFSVDVENKLDQIFAVLGIQNNDPKIVYEDALEVFRKESLRHSIDSVSVMSDDGKRTISKQDDAEMAKKKRKVYVEFGGGIPRIDENVFNGFCEASNNPKRQISSIGIKKLLKFCQLCDKNLLWEDVKNNYFSYRRWLGQKTIDYDQFAEFMDLYFYPAYVYSHNISPDNAREAIAVAIDSATAQRPRKSVIDKNEDISRSENEATLNNFTYKSK